jgi:hypothetical protein
MSLEILIGADVVPTASNIDQFSSAAPKLLFDGLDEIWRARRTRASSNLEAPLSDGADAARKVRSESLGAVSLRRRRCRAEPDGRLPLQQSHHG